MKPIHKMTNKELDDAISIEVMQWEMGIYDLHGIKPNIWLNLGEFIKYVCNWNPSSSIANAWEVVDKMSEYYQQAMEDDNEYIENIILNEFLGYFVYNQIDIFGIGPQSICNAALATVRKFK